MFCVDMFLRKFPNIYFLPVFKAKLSFFLRGLRLCYLISSTNSVIPLSPHFRILSLLKSQHCIIEIFSPFLQLSKCSRSFCSNFFSCAARSLFTSFLVMRELSRNGASVDFIRMDLECLLASSRNRHYVCTGWSV